LALENLHKDLRLKEHYWCGWIVEGVSEGTVEVDGNEWVLYGLVDFDGESDKNPVMEYNPSLQYSYRDFFRGLDLRFEKGDLVRSVGLESLETGIIFTVLTAFNELKDHPFYKDWGDKAYEVLYQGVNGRNIELLKMDIREAVKNMKRVKEVNYIEVEEGNQGELVVTIDVTANTGETLSMTQTISI